jgi:hemolysin activation/secretion protein
MERFPPFVCLILLTFGEPVIAAPEPFGPSGGEAEAVAGSMAGSMYVQRIVITGNRAIPSKLLQAAAAPYLNRELNAAQIAELLDLLTSQYIRRGYINSSVILDQATAAQDGVLRLKAVEGHITSIRVQGLERLRPAYVIDRLRASAQEIFNADVFRDRFQRLLDDPLFARINSRILPGELPEEAVIEVNAERSRPYALSVALNNYRPPAIGEKGYDVAGLVRDLTGWGDVVDADLNGPTSGPVSYSAGWQLPLNRYLTQLSLRSSYSNSVISEEPLAPIDIKSQIERQELKVTQPLWAAHAQQLNFAVSAAYEKETASGANSAASLPGAVPGETRAFALRLAPDYSYRWEHQYLGASLTLLHADTASLLQPDAHYWVSTGQLHHLWDLASAPLELETRATAQWTGARISDLHALPLGGVASVRGFREDELLLSNARSVNLDLRWLILAHASAATPALTCGTFFDWASGYDVSAPKTTLSSTGVTLRAKWSHLQADLAVGVHLIHPGFIDQEHGSWQDHGIHAQIASSL